METKAMFSLIVMAVTLAVKLGIPNSLKEEWKLTVKTWLSSIGTTLYSVPLLSTLEQMMTSKTWRKSKDNTLLNLTEKFHSF